MKIEVSSTPAALIKLPIIERKRKQSITSRTKQNRKQKESEMKNILFENPGLDELRYQQRMSFINFWSKKLMPLKLNFDAANSSVKKFKDSPTRWPQSFRVVARPPKLAGCSPVFEETLLKKKSTGFFVLPSYNISELMKGEKAALKSKMMENSHQEMGDKWRGKPVVFDSDRSTKSPVFHFVPDGFQPSLEFESRFESGNLRQARRTGENEYELVLRTDMYTNRHTQWYYFRVKNAKPNTTYKFNIINLLKKDSLYNYGMRPLVYSELQAKQDDKGWFRLGEKIRYIPWNNPTKNSMLSLDMQYYCLQFEMSFNWEGVENDVIYMAHCYPYTYTDLRRHLDEMLSCPIKSKHVRKEILCETAAGNACFLLTITNFKSNEEEFAFEEHYEDPYKGKKGVVLTSRVHPGETQASWMMKGILDFLTSNHPNAQKLRHKYIFKVIPMMNPDGVIVGNYRTSLSARDLNRNYRHPKQEAFPTVWHTKQMVEKLHQKYPIVLYCDLHGHSRRHLVFMYGCERKKRRNREDGDEEQNLLEARHFVQQRLFPWILHRLTPSRFSFQQTKFSVRKSKESTGRVVMFKQMGIENSFTLEATFSGTPKGRHFNINDFLMVGRKLCESILEYSRLEEDPAAKSRVIVDMTREIAEHARKIALKQKQQNQSAASTKEKYAVTKKDSKHEPGTNSKFIFN